MASKLSSFGSFNGANGKLFFEREGNQNGQSILFIHGLGGTTNSFQMMVPGLQDFDIVRFEWSGHGRSATPKATTIRTYVEDCESIIQHLELEPVIVIGHSLGGLIALHLAAKAPQHVNALVLLGPVRPPPEAGQKALGARAETVRKDGMAGVADAVVLNAFAASSFTKRNAQVALAREMLARQDPEGYALALEALKESTVPEWRQVKAPVWLLSGEEDKVSTVAVGQTTAKDVGEHARQRSLPDVGHWHMLEAPDECVAAIKEASK